MFSIFSLLINCPKNDDCLYRIIFSTVSSIHLHHHSGRDSQLVTRRLSVLEENEVRFYLLLFYYVIFASFKAPSPTLFKRFRSLSVLLFTGHNYLKDCTNTHFWGCRPILLFLPTAPLGVLAPTLGIAVRIEFRWQVLHRRFLPHLASLKTSSYLARTPASVSVVIKASVIPWSSISKITRLKNIFQIKIQSLQIKLWNITQTNSFIYF